MHYFSLIGDANYVIGGADYIITAADFIIVDADYRNIDMKSRNCMCIGNIYCLVDDVFLSFCGKTLFYKFDDFVMN